MDITNRFARKTFKVLESTLNWELTIELESVFSKKKRSKIEKDIRHLNYTIESNVKYFITNDHDDFIKKKGIIASKFGVKVLTPEMLITELDKLENPTKYRPIEIQGTDIVEEIVCPDSYEDICKHFYSTTKSERKNEFNAIIKQAFEKPAENDIVVYKKGDNPLGIIVERKVDQNYFIKLFRIAKNQNNYTIQQLILDNMIDKYSKFKAEKIVFEDKYVDVYDEVFQNLYFYKDDNKWSKIFKYGVVNSAALYRNTLDKQLLHADLYLTERYYWPMKLADLDINCYIVPIKLKWAQELFAKKIASETLFAHQEDKLLSRENAYYCNTSVEIKTPARILWYISNENKRDSKFIGYSSYVDEYYKDFPKVLFKNFSRLGIYEWEDVYITAKKDTSKRIKAFVFRDTEEFKEKIYLNRLREVYEKSESKKLSLQSVVKITYGTFIQLYMKGNDYE